MHLEIPKDKSYPAGAVQCDECGGHGCAVCAQKGWLPKGHQRGRQCESPNCTNPIPPDCYAVYCSNKCAFEDA